ncbi:hypothetical protein NS115_00525 [Paenibacillus jamilae]|uniref:Uncharacterized protein n=1 Tax=Paenibacillus jamilae TaxID=114136 RepID=A0ACC5A215_9BACL|nr:MULTISPECIES: hypothetical protein [Paenibacillus]AUO07844.1 hypothetical protein C0638_15560 [Paenibacillus sp. lzh-N1]KTS85271.1 hypothetical protein NS115_00525 [Paenibacillus jamilae]MBP1311989.1 hypothetical protein [Paenibacillus sp. 1182]MBU9705566.1 hypothetical protein [Paenibacillus sp. AK121]MEE4568881.1 hypothetical protein [Paenibacillus polymyxa]
MTKKGKTEIQTLIYRYSGPRANIGYTFEPLRYGDTDEPKLEEMIFIYADDFDIVLSVLKSKYPLVDPDTGETYEAFDACWDNPIQASVWHEILTELDAWPAKEPELRIFIDSFTAWVRAHLKQADGIIVTGNL